MTHTTSVWLVLLTLLLAANLPLVIGRWLAVVPSRAPKMLRLRVGEMLVFGALAIASGLARKQLAGQIAPRAWAFYVVSGALFLKLAFPGVSYRCLYKRNS